PRPHSVANGVGPAMVTLPCSRNRNGGTTSAHRITISTAASTAVWRADRRDQRVSAGRPAAAASSRACAKSAEVVTRRVPSLERFWPPLCSQAGDAASGYLPLLAWCSNVEQLRARPLRILPCDAEHLSTCLAAPLRSG